MSERQVIRCLAAVAWEANKPLSIEEVEVSPPGPGEVRIKVIATGVCRTDAYTLGGLNPDGHFPCILGHEGAGIVESVGDGVTSVNQGDHVITVFLPQCRECRFCLSSKTNLCFKIKGTQVAGKMPDGTSRFTCKGQMLYHFMGCSTFSQFTVAAEISLCKINSAAPLEKVCLLACGVSSGYGSALNSADVEPGSICAIWGLGGVGLAVAMGCRERGASRVIGIDVNPDRFEVAKKFGVTEVVNPNSCDKPIEQVIADMTDGGCDYAFECVGSADCMKAAFEACQKGWGLCVINGVVPAGHQISTKPINLLGGKVWKGSSFGGWKSRDSVPQLVESYLNKKLMVDEFITCEKKMKDTNMAFDLMQEGKAIRTVILMHQ